MAEETNQDRLRRNQLDADQLGIARDLSLELRDQLGIRNRLTDADREQLNLSRQIAQSIAATFDETTNTRKLVRQLNKDKQLQSRLEKEIAYQASITSNVALEFIDDYNKELKRRQDAEAGIVSLNKKIADASADQKEYLIKQRNELVEIAKKSDEQLSVIEDALEGDGDRYLLLLKQQALLDKTVEQRKEQLKEERKINQQLGIAGTSISAFEFLLKKSGLGGEELTFIIGDIKETMLDTVAKGGSGFKALFEGAKKGSKEFGEAFANDPLLVAKSFQNLFLAGFKELNTAVTDTTRLTGDVVVAAATLNGRFATGAQYLKQLNELTKQLGISANLVFDKDTIAAGAELQNLMGLTTEQAGKLSIISKTTNSTLDASVGNIVRQVSAFNRTNKAAVNQRLVLDDISKTSDDILISLGNQPTAIAQAAAAARRLGLALSDVNNIANSLLNFEASIENELQAQLLTGRGINLAKARELALSNDLAGLGQELFNNSAKLAEFSEMNRIQQEGLAKALGLSREQLAKIALQRSIEAGLTDKALEKAAGVTAEQLKAVSAAEAFNTSLQKIQQAFAGPLAALASLVSNAGVLAGIMTAIAGIKLTQLVLSVGALAAQLGASAIAAGALKAFTNPLALVAGIAGVAIATGLVVGGIKKAKEIQDGVISPDGGLLVSGPKGSFSLDKGDYVTAAQRPMVAGATINSNRDIIDRLDRMVSAIEKKGTITLDGYKVGEAMVIGKYNNT